MTKDMSVNRVTEKGNERLKNQQLMVLAKSESKGSLWARIKQVVIKNPIRRISHQKEVDEKLKLAFKHLHLEFNRREQQLEQRIQEIQGEHEAVLLQRKKRLRWLVPLGLTVAVAGGYMLFVLTNMQNSMANMTGSIHTMNNHMENMSGDTQSMSQNMQTMNGSMGEMNKSIAPIGEVAGATTPFVKATKSFFPF